VKFFAVFDKVCCDGTVDILKEVGFEIPELVVVWSPENKCVVDAYVRGYREALNAGSDWILEIDAGFSHQPCEIPRFFEKMMEGYDCVFGSRFCDGGDYKEAPLSRYLVSRGGSIVANVLLGTKLRDMTSGFEMFTKDALIKVLDKGIRSKGHFFQTEIKVYCRNFKVVEVPISYCQPSPNVNSSVLLDAFKNLMIMFWRRLAGKI
jgi:dolichol-phosphate mannosyltransferase